MQYILFESEMNELTALRKENEDLRSELNEQSSRAYANANLATSRLHEIEMLEATIANMKHDMAGTEQELAKARQIVKDLEHKIQVVVNSRSIELEILRKQVKEVRSANYQLQIRLAGSDFDIDNSRSEFAVFGHVNEDGSVTMYNNQHRARR